MASRSLGVLTIDMILKTVGLKQGADKAERELDRSAKRLEQKAKRIGVAFGAALATAGTALAVSMKSSIDRMDELSKAAQRVGMPTEEFSRLAYAGSLADVEVSTLVSTLGKLTKAQAAALKDTSEQAKVFDALGISAKNADGSLRAANDVMLDFADKFAAMDGSPEAMAAGFSLFGRSFQDMIPLIKDGSGAMREMFQESDALGKTLSSDAGKAAEQFNDDLTRLKTGLEGVVMQVASGMLPKLNEMTGDMVKAAKETDNLRQFGDGLATVLGAVAVAAGWVSKSVQTATVAIASQLDVMAGWYEIASNIQSFGIAGGSVGEGWAKVKNASETARGEYQRIWADPSKPAVPHVIFAGEGPEPAGLFRMSAGEAAARKEAEALRKRVAEALAEAANARPKSGGGQSEAARIAEEAARAAREAAEAQSGWHQTVLDMEATLAGPLAEANRQYERNVHEITSEYQAGNVALSDYARALEVYTKQRDAEVAAINARKGTAQEMLEDLQHEASLLGKTADEQERLNAARSLGADANTEAGRAALAALEGLQKQRQAIGDQIYLMDAARDSVKGFFTDIYEGASAWDAAKNALDRFADALFDLAASKVIEQLFGKMGTTQSGSSGNWLTQLIGAFAGAFSGSPGAASGGWRSAHSMFEVNERGLEMATVRGRDYLLTGSNPVEITPNHRMGGAGGVTVQQHFHNPRMYDRRSDSQRAAESAQKLKQGVRFA